MELMVQHALAQVVILEENQQAVTLWLTVHIHAVLTAGCVLMPLARPIAQSKVHVGRQRHRLARDVQKGLTQDKITFIVLVLSHIMSVLCYPYCPASCRLLTGRAHGAAPRQWSAACKRSFLQWPPH